MDTSLLRPRCLPVFVAGLIFASAGAAQQSVPAQGTQSSVVEQGITDRAAVAPRADAQLPATIVTGHYNNGVGTSDAASEGRITAKLIENRPLLRTGEILEFIPGMIVSQHSGDGKANQYYLRGFNLDHGTDFATFSSTACRSTRAATRMGRAIPTSTS